MTTTTVPQLDAEATAYADARWAGWLWGQGADSLSVGGLTRGVEKFPLRRQKPAKQRPSTTASASNGLRSIGWGSWRRAVSKWCSGEFIEAASVVSAVSEIGAFGGDAPTGDLPLAEPWQEALHARHATRWEAVR